MHIIIIYIFLYWRFVGILKKLYQIMCIQTLAVTPALCIGNLGVRKHVMSQAYPFTLTLWGPFSDKIWALASSYVMNRLADTGKLLEWFRIKIK